MLKQKKRYRPSTVQDDLVSQLLTMIIDGNLRPGDRLPTRNEIIEEFGACRETVQRAFERLQDDGFVTARGKAGTFISRKLPHLTRYALVFPYRTADSRNGLFEATVLTGVRALEKRLGIEFPLYSLESVTSCETYQRLLRDIRARRVAGVIFESDPYLDPDDPVLNEPQMPTVMLSIPAPKPGPVNVQLGGAESFLDRSLAYLAEQKRSRIALLHVSGVETERVAHFHKRLPDFGMTTRPHWIQTADPYFSVWANNLTQLLFCHELSEHPDGFIIADDNLVEHACGGLVQTGVHVPAEVTVVAHCNFPALTPSVLDIARLGYDIHAILETCVDLVNKQNKRVSVPEMLCVPARFEWELG